ncbi:hypothetical protein GEV43_30910 [Actinomadura sp. J1-007]|nr:hypothetical protein [Actinomadura sp. J1-007]
MIFESWRWRPVGRRAGAGLCAGIGARAGAGAGRGCSAWAGTGAGCPPAGAVGRKISSTPGRLTRREPTFRAPPEPDHDMRSPPSSWGRST